MKTSIPWLVVLATAPAIAQGLEARDLSSIQTLPSGASPSSPPPGSSTASTPTTKSSSLAVTTTPKPTPTASYDDLILITTFIQPSSCTEGLTQVAGHTDLIQYAVRPAPNLSFSDCYPQQFYNSAAASTTSPPFKQLVCPQNWETYDVTDTYIICCPRGFSLHAPFYSKSSARPGAYAQCYSDLGQRRALDITSYGSDGVATTKHTTAGESDVTLVWADAFDGTKATPSATITGPPANPTNPPCASKCLSTGFNNHVQYGCGSFHVDCACKSSQFVSDMRACDAAACSKEDAKSANDYLVYLCKNNGVTIPPSSI